ncbi:host specificity factor TipJ family phage tail protein [Phascolarctobacterium sp.]|uniref:host specificity factor TipJ family phage tail protein n=1 Tax=Phascolarctobacterium sp. TaxID=2049039 RepID=UPI003870C76C
MVKVVFVKNPFQPANGRVVKISEATERPLSFYIGEYLELLPDQKAFVQLNGRETVIQKGVTDPIVLEANVPDNSFILVMPAVEKGGKSILGLVAVVALSVVSMGVGASLATATGAWTFASYAAAAAVMFVGGSLISKLGPKATVTQYQNEDPTYSWSGVQTMEGQGNGIAITYGAVKSGGQSIMKFTNNDGNDQYFNWLISAGEGPLAITNIMLNNNPIGNYKDTTYEIREGTNDQTVIKNFNDTIQSKAISYELSNNEWREDVADGNSAEGIIVDLECQNGLYHANDNGSLGTAWIDIKAQVKLEGTDEWLTFVENGSGIYPNDIGATLTGKVDVAKYTVYVSFDTDKYLTDEDGHEYANPHYNQWRITVRMSIQDKRENKNYRNFVNYAYFNSGEQGYIDAGNFRFDKATVQAKGDGYKCTIQTFHTGRISGAKAGVVRKQFRVDNLPAGKHAVRVTVTGRSADVNSSRDGVKVWWTMLSTVVYDDFVYPNTALIGLRVKATSQISGGTPQLTFLKTRPNVWVYNPYTQAYESKASDNPAWAAYDFVHGAQRLKDIDTGTWVFETQGVPKELMLYDQFKAWADNCDSLKLKINLEVTQQQSFWETVNKEIAPVGRGLVVQFGTRFGCIYDHKSQPVQLFNMGNIIENSFQLSYLGAEDRANSIELTFVNKDKDYEKDTIVIYGDNYDTDDLANPTQITMNGITDYEQAYREGKYQLMCNKLLQRTVSFKADVESIGCMVGDLILVAHDVPQWAFSGRILEVGNGTITVPLDPAEIPSDKKWQVMIRTGENTLTTYNVAEIGGEYNAVVITLDGSFTAVPNRGDLFSLGLVDATAKPFYVKSITRDSDLVRNITALEYVEGVFNEDYDIPQPDYSIVSDGDVVNVENLTARQVAYKNNTGDAQSRMYVSWTYPDNELVDSFSILLSMDGGLSYQSAGSTSNLQIELNVQPYTDYFVKVVTVWRFKQSSGAVCFAGVGSDEPPPDVKAFDVEIMHNGMRRYYIDYDYPEPNDIAGFRMKYIQGNIPNWNVAFPVQDGLITAWPYETNTVRQGTHTIMVKAVDNAGQECGSASVIVVNFADPLEDNVLYKVDLASDTWADCEHDGSVLSDGYIHSKQNTTHWVGSGHSYWDAAESAYWGTVSYLEFNVTAEVKAIAGGHFYLLYDIDGVANVQYKIKTQDDIWKPYATKFTVKADDIVQVKITAPAGVGETVVKALTAVIDVPDREEHFENLYIPAEGVELPIVTPNYYTTAVRVDSVNVENWKGMFEHEVVSMNPCIIRVYRINNDAGWSRDGLECYADISWQGFSKEVV